MAVNPNAPAEVFGPDILGRIASFLPPNGIACSLRPVSRSTAEQFREHTIVRLSQPFPASACFAEHWSGPGACRALSYKRRLQLVCLTAASGDVNNLEVALAAAGLCLTAEVMVAAAAAGQLHVCRWLAERGCPMEDPGRSPLISAAKGGHAAVCEWLLEQGCAWSEECVLSAVRGGHPELMRALLRKAPPGREDDVSSEGLLSAVAEGCDLGTVQELWREMGDGTEPHMLTAAVDAAARSPTPDWAAKVSWLLEQGAEQGPRACEAAASCPDALSRLTLLVEGMGFPVDGTAISAAALQGRADAVRWLLARGLRLITVWQGYILGAARRGQPEVLRTLHAAGYPLGPAEELVDYACLSGSVETVSWVVETCGAQALEAEGPEAFSSALRSGSLELVTWLHERGLRPGSDPWDAATDGGCVAVLELLAEWGTDMQGAYASRGYVYMDVAGRGDLLTLEALRRLGLPLGRTQREKKALVARAIREKRAPLPALRWLRGAVGKVDLAAAADAARSVRALAGWRTEVLAWLQAEAEAEAEAKADAKRGGAGKGVGGALRWLATAMDRMRSSW